MASGLCAVCGQPGAAVHSSSSKGLIIESADCPRCGKWWFALDLMGGAIRQASPEFKAALSAYIRRANESGEKAVELTAENWREFAAAHLNTPISLKLDLLLREYEKCSGYAGEWVTLPENTYPLIDAQNQLELSFLRDTLIAQKLLESRPNKSEDHRLSAEGWEHLHPHGAGVPGTCFVAMWFDDSMVDAYEHGIRAALEVDCGYRAVQVGRKPANGDITNRIIAEIRSCQFLVADFTGQRPGVYYEAGFAEGLRRPVVRTCHADHFSQLHFDTRQFFHLKWTTPADLREALAEHVKATIGTNL